MGDWQPVHHDTLHRVMCKSSNDPKFISGRVYDAIDKGSHYHIDTGQGEIRVVLKAEFEKYFDSFITHFHVPKGTKGIMKTLRNGATSFEFN